MNHRLVIITGASRGLGAALAEQLLQPGSVMLCLSRQPHPTLAQQAAQAQVQLETWSRDLIECVAVADEVERWLEVASAGSRRGPLANGIASGSAMAWKPLAAWVKGVNANLWPIGLC